MRFNYLDWSFDTRDDVAYCFYPENMKRKSKGEKMHASVQYAIWYITH